MASTRKRRSVVPKQSDPEVLRGDLNRVLAQEAVWLKKKFEEVLALKTRGADAKRPKTIIKAEALELLRQAGNSKEVIRLFDILLDDVTADFLAMTDKKPWLPGIVEYEARALNEGREVETAELVDEAIDSTSFMRSRHYMLVEVNKVRPTEWYQSRVKNRRKWLKVEDEERRLARRIQECDE